MNSKVTSGSACCDKCTCKSCTDATCDCKCNCKCENRKCKCCDTDKLKMTGKPKDQIKNFLLSTKLFSYKQKHNVNDTRNKTIKNKNRLVILKISFCIVHRSARVILRNFLFAKQHHHLEGVFSLAGQVSSKTRSPHSCRSWVR